MKISCPEEELLADYQEGRLNPEWASEVADHLAECDVCLEGVMLAQNFARGGTRGLKPVPKRVTDSAVSLIGNRNGSLFDRLKGQALRSARRGLEWVTDLVSPMGDAHLMPVRGSRQKISENLVLVKKTFQEIETEIEIEKTGRERTLIRVRLAGAGRQEKGVRVTLKKGEREVTSSLLDTGGAVFEDIVFGRYQLVFGRDGRQLGIYSLEITESGNDGR